MSSKTSTASSVDDSSQTNKPFSVLFVCLGNICRSPAAEGVFRHLVKQQGLDSKLFIDSAGTIGYHEGNQADPRMKAASKRRGIEITSISRPIKPSDFRDFDLILAMDKQNREDILGAFERWRHRESLPADAHEKVRLMCSYCKRHVETEVPDPYYGGQQGFEKVLDMLEDACGSLLESIVEMVTPLLEAAGGATAIGNAQADQIYMEAIGGIKKSRIRGAGSYGSSLASDCRSAAPHSSSYCPASIEEIVSQRMAAERTQMEEWKRVEEARMNEQIRSQVEAQTSYMQEQLSAQMRAEMQEMMKNFTQNR